MADSDSIKLCECGCGQRTELAPRNRYSRGHIKGQPMPFLHGHSSRGTSRGISNTRLAKIWRAMISRCHNKADPAYSFYGARGIEVCDRWRNSLDAFIEDMGEPPPGKTLDRVENDGPYSPDNCEWRTRKQQANNTRRNYLVTAFGVTRTLAQWQSHTGVNWATIRARLRNGVAPEIAVSPSKEMTLAELAREFGIKQNTLYQRLQKGWSLTDALHTPLRSAPTKRM